MQDNPYDALGVKERAMIAERTRAALQAAKARGVQLGNPDLDQARPKAWAANRRIASSFAERMRPTVQPMLDDGMSYRAIARRLDQMGVPTARGGQWAPAQVSAIARRLTESTAKEQGNARP